MIESAGLALVGGAAVNAVKITHPGLVMLPLDPEQMREQGEEHAAAGGAGGGGLQTAAALVPASLLPSPDDDCSDADEGEDA